jgi:hypothetical protein
MTEIEIGYKKKKDTMEDSWDWNRKEGRERNRIYNTENSQNRQGKD